MEAVFGILVTLGMPALIVFIVRYYRFRTKELALRSSQQANPKLLVEAD